MAVAKQQRMTYSEQLRHPNWQRRRLEVLQRDEFACQQCFDTETTLHVHHRAYIRGRPAWDYPLEAMVTLCESCHEQETIDSAACYHDLLIAIWPHVIATLDSSRVEVLAECIKQGRGSDFLRPMEFETFAAAVGLVMRLIVNGDPRGAALAREFAETLPQGDRIRECVA